MSSGVADDEARAGRGVAELRWRLKGGRSSSAIRKGLGKKDEDLVAGTGDAEETGEGCIERNHVSVIRLKGKTCRIKHKHIRIL